MFLGLARANRSSSTFCDALRLSRLAGWHRLLAIDFQGRRLGEKLPAGCCSREQHVADMAAAAVATRVLAFFASAGAAAAPPILPELTDREREILGLIAQGLSNTAIAGRLALSPKTVANSVSNVFAKLQVLDCA